MSYTYKFKKRNIFIFSAEDLAAYELWYAKPNFLSKVGPHVGRTATWIGASGDQTFTKIDESLISSIFVNV